MAKFEAIRQRRKFSNVDAITTTVTCRGERSWGGTFEVEVNVTNEEYRSGRYRDLVLKACSRRATQAVGSITYMAIGDVHVCLDGKWHTQKPGRWKLIQW